MLGKVKLCGDVKFDRATQIIANALGLSTTEFKGIPENLVQTMFKNAVQINNAVDDLAEDLLASLSAGTYLVIAFHKNEEANPYVQVEIGRYHTWSDKHNKQRAIKCALDLCMCSLLDAVDDGTDPLACDVRASVRRRGDDVVIGTGKFLDFKKKRADEKPSAMERSEMREKDALDKMKRADYFARVVYNKLVLESEKYVGSSLKTTPIHITLMDTKYYVVSAKYTVDILDLLHEWQKAEICIGVLRTAYSMAETLFKGKELAVTISLGDNSARTDLLRVSIDEIMQGYNNE